MMPCVFESCSTVFRAEKRAWTAPLGELKQLPFVDLGFAVVDHHRAVRQGMAEVILGAGKNARAGRRHRQRARAARAERPSSRACRRRWPRW